MKSPVIAFAAEIKFFKEGLAQSGGVTEDYDLIMFSSKDQILDYLYNKPVVILVVQLDRLDGLLVPVLNFVRSTMPDLPIIGFSVNDENAFPKNNHGLNFYSMGKIASGYQMNAEINRTFQKLSDGGTLQSISPGVLLQFIEMERKSCTVRLFDSERSQTGVLFFVNGSLFDARLLNSHGESCACEILRWNKPMVWIENGCRISTKKIQSGYKAILLNAFQGKETSNPSDDSNSNVALQVSDKTKSEESKALTQSSSIVKIHQLPSEQELLPNGRNNRVAAALSLDHLHSFQSNNFYSDPALTSRVKQFAFAGSIIDAGHLQCGFMSLQNGVRSFFVCLDETIGVRPCEMCRRESVLQSLFQLE
jgi:hypothetical protein